MKILVCFDGSKESLKAVDEALKIADGCKVNEVSVIHVYENKFPLPFWGEDYHPTQEELDAFKEGTERFKEKSYNKLLEVAKIFEAKNLKVNTIFKEGHPAETITKVALEEGSDMVVLGSRGLSGLKKLFLGSVSNAVLQEIKTNVLIVK